MKLFKNGDKAKIIQAPENAKSFLNEIVTIISIGGVGLADDDVCVKTGTGVMLALKEHQLQKIEGAKE